MRQAIDSVYTFWFKSTHFKKYFLLKENEHRTIRDFLKQYYKTSFKIFFYQTIKISIGEFRRL